MIDVVVRLCGTDLRLRKKSLEIWLLKDFQQLLTSELIDHSVAQPSRPFLSKESSLIRVGTRKRPCLLSLPDLVCLFAIDDEHGLRLYLR